MAMIDKQADPVLLENELHEQGYAHVQVRPYGSHLVIFSVEEGQRVNRARLTKVSTQYFTLSMADHRGKWEPTPLRGTMTEMLMLLTQQFPFVLVPWS